MSSQLSHRQRRYDCLAPCCCLCDSPLLSSSHVECDSDRFVRRVDVGPNRRYGGVPIAEVKRLSTSRHLQLTGGALRVRLQTRRCSGGGHRTAQLQ